MFGQAAQAMRGLAGALQPVERINLTLQARRARWLKNHHEDWWRACVPIISGKQLRKLHAAY